MSDEPATTKTEIDVNDLSYTIYHPDGRTSTVSSSANLDCEVQSGCLVIKVNGRTSSIYSAKDWVSVNVPPR